ncbi:hypothetical protein BsWGS_24139 [Bradybaena similaris]
MRTRDRPWFSAVTRQVWAREEVTHSREPVSPRTRQLAGRKERPYQSQTPQIYTSCRNKAYDEERNIYLTQYQTNDFSETSFPKTVVQAAKYQPLLSARYSPETSGRKTALLRQNQISKNRSIPLCDRPASQISNLSAHPPYLMTRKFPPRRSKSASRLRLKVWPLNRDNSRSSEVIVNTDRSAVGRGLYPHSSIVKPVAENTTTATVDNITNSGMRNRYRNINEALFDLSPDSETRDVSCGSTFGVANNGRKSPAFGQMSAVSTSQATSSPDLPPIVNELPRGDKWKKASSIVSSTTGAKISTDRRPTAVNRTSNYSRRNSTASTAESNTYDAVIVADDRLNKDRLPICRNHSDSSLYKLNAGGSYPSKGSDSTTTSCAAPRLKEASGSSDSSQGRDDTRKRDAKDAKYLGICNRKPTLRTADIQGRLETLFEGQNSSISIANSINNNANNDKGNYKAGEKYSYNQVGVSNKATMISDVNRSIYNNNNNSSTRVTNNLNITSKMPSVSPLPRSVFVKDVANNEGTSRHRNSNRKPKIEGNCTDTKTAGRFTSSKNRIPRSQSEGKLSEKSTCNKYQETISPGSISRNVSVERVDKLGSNSQKYIRAVTSSRHQQSGNFQTKYNSTSNISNQYSKEILNDARNNDGLCFFEDTIKVKDRLVEWLNIVNNVDRYEIDPKDDIVDYSDEPPQTDTAIHLVYEGE